MTAPDFTNPTSEQAWLARKGLHSLSPWWDPERGDINPLVDPETQAAVRLYIDSRWRHLQMLRLPAEAAEARGADHLEREREGLTSPRSLR
jgi:hypothetical protein